MAERVLNARELNRALLARQLLLERSSLPIPRALERVAGLQTQYAPSGYVSLWTRLRDFHREELTSALERRRVVQATLMRVTIHTVSARDFLPFAAAIRRERRDWWSAQYRHQAEGVDMAAIAERVRKHLSAGPCRASELKELLASEGIPAVAWSGLGMWIDLVRVPPSGTWSRRRADLYGLADDWLGTSPPSEAEGLEHLVRRYLGGFGPASVKDMASWAGLSVRTLAPVVERMPLRRFRDEHGGGLLDVPRAPIPNQDTPAPARFLPTWEAMLLVHARRTQVLPDEYRPLVFNTRTPHSVSTFLVDGKVAGIWRHEGGRLHLEPFEPLPRVARRELEEESKGLAAFHAD